ncbi:protein of unknown function [Shewanella benthica]|uniref:Uncharacterized protein n=1 Tax=Shewanella benthica TaxID=43661 RepID=A0A330M9Y9_9GAMM|nr:protein of unknown function [Shewanella benthica]
MLAEKCPTLRLRVTKSTGAGLANISSTATRGNEVNECWPGNMSNAPSQGNEVNWSWSRKNVQLSDPRQ